MKREIAIGIICVLLIAGLIAYYTAAYTKDTQPSGQTNTQATSRAGNTNTALTLTSDVIAQHGTSTDCWLIIGGTVYDVTNFLSVHPGGSTIVIPYCGKEATSAFSTKAGQGNHSSLAQSELAMYLVGAMGETVSTLALEQVQQRPIQTPYQGSEEEDEDS